MQMFTDESVMATSKENIIKEMIVTHNQNYVTKTVDQELIMEENCVHFNYMLHV